MVASSMNTKNHQRQLVSSPGSKIDLKRWNLIELFMCCFRWKYDRLKSSEIRTDKEFLRLKK